jgi:5-hydroxyisourate hydrolase-like protein (transthyretin family)
LNSTNTDSDGRFCFDTVCEAPLQVNAYYNDPLDRSIIMTLKDTLRMPAQPGDTNIALKLHDPRFPTWPGAIKTTGIVFDPNGAPVSGVSLAIGDTPNPFQMITSDNNGKYKIHWYRIQNGQSSVNPNLKSTLFARDTARHLAATQEIDATTTNLDLHLQPGCTLSGSVQNSDGTPSTNAIVELYMKFFRAQPLLEEIQTDANGLFSFKTLPREGKYQLGINAADYGSVSVSAQFASDSDNFQLPPIKLKAANLQLAGTVLDPDGNPISGVNVNISGRGQPRINAQSDAGGHFFFNHVAEGNIRIATVAGSLNGFLQAQGGDTNVILKLHL